MRNVALQLTCALLVGTTTASVAFAKAPAKASAMDASAVRSEHRQALSKALNGDVKGGLRALRALAKKALPAAEADRVQMSIGRLAYETGDYEGAVAAYDKVDKNGSSWLESMEEAAWAEFRNNETQKALAKLKTVTSPAFKGQVRSEPFFLQGLAQLRVCDFKSVFKTIDLFKSRFADDVKSLEASASSSDKAKLKEIGNTVQKLNLVEAETIQRLYLDENGKKRSGSVPKISKASDQLSFPTLDDEELWMDELEGFKVTTKGCLEIDDNLGVAKSVAQGVGK
jgi:hypothetical protein